MTERPRKIVLGQANLEIFDSAIQEAHGELLQNIAERDNTEAIRALSTGMRAILMHEDTLTIKPSLVEEGAAYHFEATSTISRIEDGTTAFEGTVELEVAQSTAWSVEALEHGREIVVCVLRDDEQKTLPIPENETVTVAVIRPA